VARAAHVTPKGPFTPATKSKQHCGMLHVERFLRHDKVGRNFHIVVVFGMLSV